jgi:chloramphenicol 3-O phosphotransferase
VDHVVINQNDGKEQRCFNQCIKRLEGYPLMLVKVVCPIDELRRREMQRGDRDIGNAEWQMNQGLYPTEGYDITVDTFEDSLAECADRIIQKRLDKDYERLAGVHTQPALDLPSVGP